MALTEKQKLFCNEYLIDLNATQAAIRAGYSEKTASSASKWLNDDPKKPKSKHKAELVDYVKQLMSERQSDKVASQQEVLETLTAVMRRQQKEQVVTSERHRRSYFDEEGRKVTEDTEVPVTVEIDTKISDVNKAAELLGKRYGLFSDKVNVEATAKVVIVDDLEE